MIHNEDCLETMKRMSDNSVDLILTSPPYNMNLRVKNGKYVSRQIVKKLTTKYENFSDNLPMDIYYAYHLTRLKEMLRVSPTVFYIVQFLTGNKRALFKMIGEMNEQLKEIIVWDKQRYQPAIRDGVLNSGVEHILVFSRDSAMTRRFENANFPRGTLNNMWTIPTQKIKVGVEHGAVFPITLAERIIVNFSKKDDLVYDPFAGLGTSLLVAKQNQRRFLGSEIYKPYINVAEERLQACLI